MKQIQYSYRLLASLGLIVAFLATSVVLPIINGQNAVSENSTVSFSKSSDDSRNQSTQLPLAENEKEEESRTERNTEYSFEFCVSQFLQPFSADIKSSPILHQVAYHLTSPEVPLYLFKRTLLI